MGVGLNHLGPETLRPFLAHMARLADAILAVTGATRINDEILGNSDPELLAHVFPRYATEPEELRRLPVWFYDWDTAPKFHPELHAEMRASIREALNAPAK